jgi:hypothetical protein
MKTIVTARAIGVDAVFALGTPLHLCMHAESRRSQSNSDLAADSLPEFARSSLFPRRGLRWNMVGGVLSVSEAPYKIDVFFQSRDDDAYQVSFP